LIPQGGPSMIGPYESSVARSIQKLGIDQRFQQCIAHGAVESPQPLGLRSRQAKSRHFDVLAPDTPQDFVEYLWNHLPLYGGWISNSATLEQPVCHEPSGSLNLTSLL
jgi:hypothetical protein